MSLILELLLTLFIMGFNLLLAANSIDMAIKYFMNERYFMFGLELVMAITFVCFIINRIFF